MFVRILEMAVAFQLLYLFFRLRHFFLARAQDRRKYCHAYVVGFDENDSGSGPDGRSDHASDSHGTPSVSGAVDRSLIEWPSEIEFEPGPATGAHSALVETPLAHHAKAPGHPRRSRFCGAILAVIALLPLSGLITEVHGQQTVFNVPTTDVLDRGKAYFELDISAKPTNFQALSRFFSFVTRFVVGAGGRLEVGLNALRNFQSGADATTLVPAMKWKVYDGKENGWAMVAGAHLHVPVQHKAYDPGNYSYVMASKTFQSNTRVGFGSYFFSKNVVSPDASRTGGQFTFEQPITKKLNFNADRFTGNHASGYFTTGVAYKLANKLMGLAAYSIGNANASKGNHFFYFEMGINLN